MGRKRVRFARIVNETERKQSLARRQQGLKKKIDELTTLCGVLALCIIYPTVGKPTEPLIWPTDGKEAEELLKQFYSIPDMERYMKMTDHEQYLKEIIAKTNEKHMKLMKKNKNMETAFLMHEFHFGKGIQMMDMQEIYNLEWLLKEKINELRKKREDVEPQPPAPFDYYENITVTPEARS
ncbi:Agamous-like MADS-box protein AGL80 [Linum perenne]